MSIKFNKNDKLLPRAFIIVDIICILYGIIGALYGILILANGGASSESIVTGVLVLILVPLMAFAYWVICRVVLNALCDIKLIRNKLYGIDNGYLAGLTEDNKSVSTPAPAPVEKSNTDKLKELKELLDSGAITQEEFDSEKQKILNKD